jgi:hypothetical protein
VSEFIRHLERDAARMREEFGPVDAIVEVQRHGLQFIRAFCTDQQFVKIREERSLVASVPRLSWRPRVIRENREIRRNLHSFYDMERAEIDRRMELCETVARAWGLA